VPIHSFRGGRYGFPIHKSAVFRKVKENPARAVDPNLKSLRDSVSCGPEAKSPND